MIDPFKVAAERTGQGNGNGHHPQGGGDVSERSKIKSSDYLEALRDLGYVFRLNLAGSIVEVNDKPITDELEAKIRVQMRDRGFKGMQMLKDVCYSSALDNAYHPIRDYLGGLDWDGHAHIENLGTYVKDRDGVFGAWSRKWLIGAVAKAYGKGQNAMLVLEGGQNLGKSHLARWLCPLPDYFIEGAIDPDDKDSSIRLMSKWIWEVSELGSTLRRSDREALKFFITQHRVTVRKAFGRWDTEGDAMASLIGTINNEAGFLSDPTGSRRFLVCKMEAIDWNYTRLDRDQIWAEAAAAYRAGEGWTLTPEEARRRDEINRTFEIDDPIALLIDKYFELDPNGTEFMPSLTMLKTLEAGGLRGGTSKSNLMAIVAAMKKLGFESVRPKVEGDRRRGFRGVKAKNGAPIIDT